MFRLLIRFLAASLVSVFHSECLPRVFDVMSPKIKPHLAAPAALAAWTPNPRKRQAEAAGIGFVGTGPGQTTERA